MAVKNRNKLRAQARKLIGAGHSSEEVALDIGVPSSTIRRWTRERGWGKPKYELSPLVERRLRLMAKQGWCRKTIGKSLGINGKTLKGLAADRGIVFATGERPRSLAAGLKLSKRKRWEAEIKRRSDRDIAAMDEWAWA